MEENKNSIQDQPQDDLNQRFEAAQREAAENRDRYLRALAESENMRKRLERLCEERMWQEKKRLLIHFLELGDHLEKALKYTDDDEPVGEGVRITYQQLHKVLEQEGVQAVRSLGSTFDPEMHEAVELTSSDEPPNTVTLEYQRGYSLNGKLLRPARVQVSCSDSEPLQADPRNP